MRIEEQPKLVGYCKHCGSEVYEHNGKKVWTGPVECGCEVEEEEYPDLMSIVFGGV